MKNTIKLLGIIALVAVIGFSFAACEVGGGDDGDDGNPFVGTWKSNSYNSYTFKADLSYTYRLDTGRSSDGIYTYSGNIATLDIGQTLMIQTDGSRFWFYYFNGNYYKQ